MTDFKTLARQISMVENESPAFEKLLLDLPATSAKIIGITGPPGAGKSSLTDALISKIIGEGLTVAVLCIDPSSPFNKGALLGDRIRMSNWYNHPQVYIRSLASRGALGGLHPNIIEITEVTKSAGFDFVIIETVGVGQSEVDIAGLADVTLVLLVPEGGDVIQSMKAGLMEIADVFVINKSDRPGAEELYQNTRKLVHTSGQPKKIPVVKTVASKGKGLEELYKVINNQAVNDEPELKPELLTRRVLAVIQKKRMKDMDVLAIKRKIADSLKKGGFNLYRFVKENS